MKTFVPFRYAAFALVGAVVAGAIFYVLGLLIGPHFEIGTDLIESWIVRATCSTYELAGTVRDARNVPVGFAVVEAIYDEQRLTTRSGPDGTYRLVSTRRVCAPLPQSVTVTANADGFRPARRVLAFGQRSFDFVVERSRPAG
jgi:hypothetical protein